MKDLVGYEGRYGVSEDGRIWSYPKYHHDGYWLNPTLSRTGYLVCGLRDMRKKTKIMLVHRLLAEAYFGKDALRGKIVHHKNGLKTDNRQENLELLTQSNHAEHHGYLRPRIERKELLCAFCGVSFLQSVGYIRSKVERGNKDFYCSHPCYGKSRTKSH